MRHAFRPLLVLVLATCASASSVGFGCAAPVESADVDSTEAAATRASVLRTVPTAPALVTAAASAADASGLRIEATTFRYDAAKNPDAKRVLASMRAQLTNARLRSDDGEATQDALTSTLTEYGLEDGPDKTALATAVEQAASGAALSSKLWLRSDDVPGADREWAEVVFLWVVPARGTAVRLTIRYEA